jgi:MYXO-CTERM domain-containing protein
MLTGNLEGNGNGIVVLLDTRAGGAVAGSVGAGFGIIGSVGGQRIDDWGTDTDGGAGVSPTPGGGSILDPTFNPDVALEINAGGGGADYFTHIIDLTLPNDNTAFGVAGNIDVFLGQNVRNGTVTTQMYSRADADTAKGHNGTIEHAFNNSNTAGVNGYDFGTPPGPLGDPLSATMGYEAVISSAFLANDGQPIRALVFITNSGGDFLSNQFLGESGLNGAGNLAGAETGAPMFDAQIFPGNQFFTVPNTDGDHNGDGIVDAADYVAWRKMDGTPGGYNDFFQNFAEPGTGGGGSNGVPEPGSLVLAVLGGLVALRVRRRS